MFFSLLKNFKIDFKYLAASFLAGFGLMTLELTATRIVAPHIGASIYTWTAIIGTVLLGSSIGYVWGGIQIDKHPVQKTIFYFSVGSAVFISLINIFIKFLPTIALSGMSALLISISAAIFLFFIPSILIGAISPCLLKLKTKELANVGVGAGIISASWSAGSVLGTVLTGFFLVGIIGSQKIIFIVSAIFLLVAALFTNKKAVMLPLVAVLCLLPLNFSKTSAASVFKTESDYYSIEVAEKNLPILGPVRLLFLDFGSHSIESTDGRKIHNYPESFPVFFSINPGIKSVHLIGGGAQTISKKIHAYRDNVSIDSIEIDPAVNEAAKKYFEADNGNTNFLVGDARLNLSRESKRYDLIFGDAFNSVISVPGHLLTKEFNELVKTRLNENGVYALNIASSLSGENSALFGSVLKTFAETFPNYILLSFNSSRARTQNIILVGVNNDSEVNIPVLRAKLLKEEDGEWLSSLIVDGLPELNKGVILTDDFFPTEKLLLPNLNTYFNQYASFYYSILNK